MDQQISQSRTDEIEPSREPAANAPAVTTRPPATAPAADSPLRRWILQHDESWLFVGMYITLAVVLSIWISLFWLVAVVAGHFVLEWIRHSHVDPWRPGVLVRALWEIKLDIGLVLFALVIGVYMEFILGIAGLSSAARAGLQSGARFAGWQRAIRGVLLSIDDAAQLGRAVVRGDSENNVDDSETAESTLSHRWRWGGWTVRWSLGDRLSISLSIISITLILLAPLLADQTFAETWSIILEELHPYPVD